MLHRICTLDLPGCSHMADYQLLNEAGHLFPLEDVCADCAAHFGPWMLYDLDFTGQPARTQTDRHKGDYPPPPTLPAHVQGRLAEHHLRSAISHLSQAATPVRSVLGHGAGHVAKTIVQDLLTAVRRQTRDHETPDPDLPHLQHPHPAGGEVHEYPTDHRSEWPTLPARPHGSPDRRNGQGDPPRLPVHTAAHKAQQAPVSDLRAMFLEAVRTSSITAVAVDVYPDKHMIVVDVSADIGDGKTLTRREQFPAGLDHCRAILDLAHITGAEIRREVGG